jgi:hypothetical protein
MKTSNVMSCNGAIGYTREDFIFLGYGTVSYPRRTKSSATLLQKCQNL